MDIETILHELSWISVKIVSTISWSFNLSSLEIFVFEVHLSIRDLNWQFPREAPFQIFITPGRTRYWWNPRQLFEKKKMVELTVSEDKIQITLRILGRGALSMYETLTKKERWRVWVAVANVWLWGTGARCRVTPPSPLISRLSLLLPLTALTCIGLLHKHNYSVQKFRAISLLTSTNMLSSISEHNEQMV